MGELPTYENDKDLSQLIYTEISDDKVLSFLFKKGGKVNVVNLTYCVNTYGKKDIAANLVSLEAAGLISFTGQSFARVTAKARWQRFRDSKELVTVGVLCGIIAFAIELIRVLKSL
jgi:hypothetical protein